MSEQSRRPAGSPGGGQFGEVLRRESLADLEIDDGLGWDGSFHAVPQFPTATQVYNFFTEHAPPDLTVFKLRRMVNERSADDAEQRWKADFDRRSSRWDAENPAPDRGGRRSAALEAHQRRRDEFLASLEQSMGEAVTMPQIELDRTRRFARP